jgi:cytochrome o ubiquinol oxidase subunit I
MNLLGKLDWSAIPLHQPIIMGATAFMVLVVLVVLGFVTAMGAWPYLWREWLTSVDHKRIGAMYCILALVMMRSRRSQPVVQKVICRLSISIRFSPRTARS